MKAVMRVCLAVLALAVSARAQEQHGRFEQAYERLGAYMEREMRTSRTPGMALALTTRDRLLHVFTLGYADVKTRQPVTPETLFEIGSISKSFTAITLLQLREQGKIDFQQPVKTYLPWFDVQTKFAPITVHHLLTHTAGIPRDRDDIPSSLYQAYALRERSTGYAPGIKFAYSNIGYQVLGYLVEQLTGQVYPEAIRQRIFEPLGMKSSDSAITDETRKRMAVGYVPFYDDRPNHSSYSLVEAAWMEYGAGDGSIAATPADLAAYLRMLLNHGVGPNGRLISEETFKLLTHRAIKAGDSYYGYGLSVREEGGHTILSHGGGMVGYGSSLAGDLDDGVGVVAFVNGPGTGGRVVEYAMRLLRALQHDQELPPIPAPPDPPTTITNAAEFAGTFTSTDGRKLTFAAEGESLFLLHAGQKIQLERRGPNGFFAPHPEFTLFLFVFGRGKPEGAEKEGKVAEVSYGPDWYTNERYTGPRSFQVPTEWAAYVGHYRSYSPWLSNIRILIRKDKLMIVFPGAGAEPLVPLGPGVFQLGEEETAERLRIDSIVNGKALRANLSGVDLYRSFTP